MFKSVKILEFLTNLQLRSFTTDFASFATGTGTLSALSKVANIKNRSANVALFSFPSLFLLSVAWVCLTGPSELNMSRFCLIPVKMLQFSICIFLDPGRSIYTNDIKRKGNVLFGRATGLDAFLSTFSTSRRCSRNGLSGYSRIPVSPMYDLFAKRTGYAMNNICALLKQNSSLPFD